MAKSRVRINVVLKSMILPLASIVIGWSIFIIVAILVLKLLRTDIVFIESRFYESVFKTVVSLIMVMIWLISWHYATKYLRNRLMAMR